MGLGDRFAVQVTGLWQVFEQPVTPNLSPNRCRTNCKTCHLQAQNGQKCPKPVTCFAVLIGNGFKKVTGDRFFLLDGHIEKTLIWSQIPPFFNLWVKRQKPVTCHLGACDA